MLPPIILYHIIMDATTTAATAAPSVSTDRSNVNTVVFGFKTHDIQALKHLFKSISLFFDCITFRVGAQGVRLLHIPDTKHALVDVDLCGKSFDEYTYIKDTQFAIGGSDINQILANTSTKDRIFSLSLTPENVIICITGSTIRTYDLQLYALEESDTVYTEKKPGTTIMLPLPELLTILRQLKTADNSPVKILFNGNDLVFKTHGLKIQVPDIIMASTHAINCDESFDLRIYDSVLKHLSIANVDGMVPVVHIRLLHGVISFETVIGKLGTIKVMVCCFPKEEPKKSGEKTIYHMYHGDVLLESFMTVDKLNAAAQKRGIIPEVRSGLLTD